MAEVWYMLSGGIPGGFTLLLFVLLLAQSAWWYIVYRNRVTAGYRAVKNSLWIFLGWLSLFLLLRYWMPSLVLPIRLAVYPLAGPEFKSGLGYQLARELEEGIAATNQRWSVGAFRRLGSRPLPAYSLSDADGNLPKLLLLQWIVTGEWQPVPTQTDQITLQLKLTNIATGENSIFEKTGNTNQILEQLANEIANATGHRKRPARVAPMSPLWRSVCARSIIAEPNDTTVIKEFEQAYHSDSLATSGFAWMLQYRMRSKELDPEIQRWEPAMLRLLHYAETQPLFLQTMGEYLRRRGDVEKAAAALLLAHGHAPANPEPHFYLSLMSPSQTQTKFQKTAPAHATRAVELDPGYELARLRMLEFLPPNPLQNLLAAIVEPGLKINPDSPQLLLRKAYYQLSEANPTQVLVTLNRVINLDSTISTAYYNRGIAYLRMNDTTKAIVDFHKCWAMNGTVESLYYLGIIYENSAQIDSAIFYLNLRYKNSSRATDGQATIMARGKLVNLLQKR
ncbi:MAG: hypothetical protein OEM52_05210 [bacterium]|nr:hypothetical protein [bacterium]